MACIVQRDGVERVALEVEQKEPQLRVVGVVVHPARCAQVREAIQSAPGRQPRKARRARVRNLLSKTQAFLTIGSSIVSFGERERFRKLLWASEFENQYRNTPVAFAFKSTPES